LNYTIIILAAGGSARLGRPKQLLDCNGQKLIRHIVSAAEHSSASSIIVVLGSDHELIANEIPVDHHFHVVINDEWQEGMASSIRKGLKFLQDINPAAETVIFTVCDQPFITSSLLNDLVSEQMRTRKTIVACAYENTLGTPVLFQKSLFPELLALKGDAGAKKIIKQHEDDVATIPFTKGNMDIDTNEDYQALINSF
jgi:molybdenum cofactor cytidylyltransferase